MKVKYDKEVDILYIQFTDEKSVKVMKISRESSLTIMILET